MSIVPRTIGFEAEYECNVDPLIRKLYNDRLSRTSGLHDYHCSCSDCQFNIGWEQRFRAQRDSSCAGEIITNIMALDDLPRTAQALSDACYEVDAEPGLNAGLHVHVGVPNEDYETRLGTLLVFALYEQSLGMLAAGPFRALRGMNRTVAQGLNTDIFGGGRIVPIMSEWEIYQRIEWLLSQGQQIRRAEWNQIWQNWERHANLSPARAHPTMEVRIWNSTRAAWRIEMYCRISHHLTSPDVYERLFANAHMWMPEGDEPLDVTTQGAVLCAVLVDEDPSLGLMLQRQLAHHHQIADSLDPIQFTLT